MTARLLLVACLLSATIAWADERPWFQPAHSGKAYVNPYLTPERVIGADVPPSWNGQLVLWQGRIRSQARDGRQTDLVLATAGGDVDVHYRWKATNLETDRSGYRVAVKGNIVVEDGRLQALDGHSLILLQPPPNLDCTKSAPSLHDFLSWWIGFHNLEYTPELRDEIAAAIIDEGKRNQLDPLFFASLVQIESAFRVDAVSRSGAIGLGQLMPFIARGYGVDPYDPRQNLQASARMIGSLVRAWKRSANPYALALAGYNAGPSLVRSVGRVPAIPQTTNYVYFIGFVHQEMTASANHHGVN